MSRSRVCDRRRPYSRSRCASESAYLRSFVYLKFRQILPESGSARKRHATTYSRSIAEVRRVASRLVASRRVASHRVATHRIASHRVASRMDNFITRIRGGCTRARRRRWRLHGPRWRVHGETTLLNGVLTGAS